MAAKQKPAGTRAGEERWNDLQSSTIGWLSTWTTMPMWTTWELERSYSTSTCSIQGWIRVMVPISIQLASRKRIVFIHENYFSKEPLCTIFPHFVHPWSPHGQVLCSLEKMVWAAAGGRKIWGGGVRATQGIVWCCWCPQQWGQWQIPFELLRARRSRPTSTLGWLIPRSLSWVRCFSIFFVRNDPDVSGLVQFSYMLI